MLLPCAGPRRFRFEANWEMEQDFQTIVSAVWETGAHACENYEALRAKLQRYGEALIEWSRGKTRHGQQTIKALTAQLEEL